jgi:hypothetical protein
MIAKLTPAQRAEVIAAYRAEEPVAALARRFGVSPQAIYWIANQAGVRRRTKVWGRRYTGEHTVPTPGGAPRAPLLPWYTDHPDPTPPPLADVVARPRFRYQRSCVPLWPRGADEEALCVG